MTDYIVFGSIAIVCIVMIAIIVADWQADRTMQEYFEYVKKTNEYYLNFLQSRRFQNHEPFEETDENDDSEGDNG